MEKKIFEKLLDKPVKLVCENVDKSLKEGLFNKWGKFDYKWNKEKNKLFLTGKVARSVIGEVAWSGEIVFLKKKIVFFVDMPALFRPFVIPKIIKELEEKLPGIIASIN